MGHDLSHGRWGFIGEARVLVGLWVEGVGAMIEHALRVVLGMGCSLDAQVAEHGVRFPPA